MKKWIAALLALILCFSFSVCAVAEDYEDDDESYYDVGDYVYFGHYEQNNKKDGKEKIQWIVLDEKDGYLFLLSRYGLDRQRFNEKSTGQTWKQSELRRWLNSTFMDTAFTSKEKKAIKTTKVVDNKKHTYKPSNTAKRFGGTTKDKVFLLSYKELHDLVPEDEIICTPTKYLIAKRVSVVNQSGKKGCWYWLRTSAYKNNAVVVSEVGKILSCYLHHPYGVIRPALWVEADAVTD